MKKGFVADIEKETVKNTDFRRVLYTGKFSQLVLMCLKPGEEIGEETHDDVDQFFRFEEGEGKVVIDGVEHAVKDGSAVIVPSGAKHNVLNTSKAADLKLYTIYSPPEHQDKVVRKTRQDAMARKSISTGRRRSNAFRRLSRFRFFKPETSASRPAGKQPIARFRRKARFSGIMQALEGRSNAGLGGAAELSSLRSPAHVQSPDERTRSRRET